MRERVMAVVITFNPKPVRLQENLLAIHKQVDHVVVMDNASENIREITSICRHQRVRLKAGKANRGLGATLNWVFQEYGLKYEWILLLDQDTVCPPDYIEKAKRYSIDHNIGIITSAYFEKNLGRFIGRKEKIEKNYGFIKRCITSGALVRTEAYRNTRGFDEYFFVDYVDFDFSVKIRHAGYRILCMYDVYIEHELGDSSEKRFLLWKLRYTEHTAQREYYIARNIVIFVKRYLGKEKILRDCLSLCKHYVFTVLYDKDKKEKLKALWAGTVKGVKYKEGL